MRTGVGEVWMRGWRCLRGWDHGGVGGGVQRGGAGCCGRSAGPEGRGAGWLWIVVPQRVQNSASFGQTSPQDQQTFPFSLTVGPVLAAARAAPHSMQKAAPAGFSAAQP
jgi:hypothetical protein